MILELLVCVAVLWFTYRVIAYRLLVRSVRRKGFRVVDRYLDFSMMCGLAEAILGVFPPLHNAVNSVLSFDQAQLGKRITEALQTYETPVVAFVSYNNVNIFTCDADIAQQATVSTDGCVDKRVEAYGILLAYGQNVVTTRGEEWKRHRQACAAAFSKSNLRLVRAATVKNASLLLEVGLE
jgi:cytochrome P450